MNHDFNYSPTFLYGVNSSLDYYHNRFEYHKGLYIKQLEKLKEMESPDKDPICVKTFELKYLDHPKDKADFYTKITSYIEENQSEYWIFSHTEDLMEGQCDDPYSDYSEVVLVVKVFAVILDEKVLLDSDVYKDQIKKMQTCLVELEAAKRDFVNFIKEYK